VALAAVTAGEQYDVGVSLAAHVTELRCALLIVHYSRRSLHESAPNVKHDDRIIRIREGQDSHGDNAHEVDQKDSSMVFFVFLGSYQ
jgi:hypothetical protein